MGEPRGHQASHADQESQEDLSENAEQTRPRHPIQQREAVGIGSWTASIAGEEALDVWHAGPSARRRDHPRVRRRMIVACGAAMLLAGQARHGKAAAGGDAAATPKTAAPSAAPVHTAIASPQTVIHGGAIPEGWVPAAIPSTGVGPDGKPITVMIAPTYVFTYPLPQPVTPPAQAAAQTVTRPVAPSTTAARPVASVPYGSNWMYQTQGVLPAATTLVASRPPPPPTTAAWGGSPLGQPWTPPAPVPVPVPMPPPAVVAAPPPMQPVPPPTQGRPTQWGSMVQSGPFAATPMMPAAAAPQTAALPVTPLLAASIPAAMAPAVGSMIAAQPSAPSMSPAPIGAATSGAPPVAAIAPAQAATDPPLRPTPPSPPPASQGSLWRVVGVTDGDLLTCLDDTNLQQKVRLAEIDAPELGQDYGMAAREALADLVFGKTVRVFDQGKDRNGRWIARVYVDGVDVNRQLVAEGYAWHYAAASSDASLDQLQQQARQQRLGLWSQPDPVPPWLWRQREASMSAAVRWLPLLWRCC